MGGAILTLTSGFGLLRVRKHQQDVRSLPVKGVSKHWNLRYLVYLMGKVLYPAC
jgi:hypothetical protein